MPRFGSLFLAGDQVIVQGWDDGEVRAIESETGMVLWSVEHDHPGRTGRFSESGQVVAATEDPESGDILVLVVSDPPYRD